MGVAVGDPAAQPMQASRRVFQLPGSLFYIAIVSEISLRLVFEKRMRHASYLLYIMYHRAQLHEETLQL